MQRTSLDPFPGQGAGLRSLLVRDIQQRRIGGSSVSLRSRLKIIDVAFDGAPVWWLKIAVHRINNADEKTD